MANIVIQGMVLGMVGTNVFLLQNEDTKETVIIDPADRADLIEKKINEMGGHPAAILLTHGHFDHVLALDDLRDQYGIDVYAETSEQEILQDPWKNLSSTWGMSFSTKADKLFSEGDVLEVAGMSLTVMHTPGHTQGSCCFYMPDDNVLFSGDTLFQCSYGRIDFPTSSAADMKASVRRLLTTLPDETQVLPGHENLTTIGFEKRYNPLAP